MTLKAYLWGLKFATLLSFVALLSVVWFFDPYREGWIGLVLFYLSVLFFFSGIFATMLTAGRRRAAESEEVLFINVGMSFRQGVLLALLVVALLLLQSFRVLVWWDGLLVVAGILLAELYFLTR
ncbi:hypothetical protein EPO05_03620 [Patescibacteria group bacterium]|nr:MAG: hypothetical protein EPO05_03620 [Patescibacteria group bacterium]